MRRSAILVLLALWLVHPVQAADLEVRATVPAGGGVVVEWSAVPGAVLSCVLRVDQGPRYRDQLLGCADRGGPPEWRQGTGSRDLSATVVPGDALEVRAYDGEGLLLARGRVVVGVRLWLPSITKPPAR